MYKPEDEVKEHSRNEGYQDGYLAGKLDCLIEHVTRMHNKGLTDEMIANLLDITVHAVNDILKE